MYLIVEKRFAHVQRRIAEWEAAWVRANGQPTNSNADNPLEADAGHPASHVVSFDAVPMLPQMTAGLNANEHGVGRADAGEAVSSTADNPFAGIFVGGPRVMGDPFAAPAPEHQPRPIKRER